jgi:hypothetical protein
VRRRRRTTRERRLAGREISAPDPAAIEAAPVDHLAEIAEVMRGERRVRTQVVLSRLAEHDPDEYEGWSFTDLAAALAEHGITPRKSDGVKVIRQTDIANALADRTTADIARLRNHDAARETDRDTPQAHGRRPVGPLRNRVVTRRRHPLIDTPAGRPGVNSRHRYRITFALATRMAARTTT